MALTLFACYSELIAEGHVTNICKMLYGSPGHTLSAKEVYIGLDGDEKERLNALRMVLSSGRVSVSSNCVSFSFLYCIFILVFLSDLMNLSYGSSSVKP